MLKKVNLLRTLKETKGTKAELFEKERKGRAYKPKPPRATVSSPYVMCFIVAVVTIAANFRRHKLPLLFEMDVDFIKLPLG